MPGVIVKSCYMVNRTHIVNYMRYIATREGVELLTPSVRQRPATTRQKEYIAAHQKDIRKLAEYKTYMRDGTIDAASKLITAYSERAFSMAVDYKEYAQAAREPIAGDPSQPATAKQEQFIAKHTDEAEGLPEYEDFQKQPTIGNASALIGMIAEMNPTDPEIYLRYIAERPGVEKGNGPDGLFNLHGKADLSTECEQVVESTSVVWAHIVSLRREDATRLGVDHPEAWRRFLAAEAPRIAQLYHISPANLRILAAFHNEGHHPHIHMLTYSSDPHEGTITKEQMRQAGKKMRSLFTNSIFREDLAPIKEFKTQARDEISQHIQDYKNTLYGKKVNIDPEITNAACSLAHALTVSGKKQYAYLPQELKQQVDSVLRLIVQKDPAVGKLVEAYFSCERKMLELYHDKPEDVDAKCSEAMNRFYSPRTGKYAKVTDRTALHNCIIRWACAIQAEHRPERDTSPSQPHGNALPGNTDIKPEALPVQRGASSSQPEDAIDHLLDRAEHGDSQAQYNIGIRLIQGNGIAKNPAFAFSALTISADCGNADAQYKLAQMFRDGIGTTESAFHADEYFYKAYQGYSYEAQTEGNPFAFYRLGVMSQNGEGCFQDKKEALEDFKTAAKLGHVHSMFLAGQMLLDDSDVPVSIKQFDLGCHYLETASHSGHNSATFELSKIYMSVADPEMQAEGISLLRKAASNGYFPARQYLNKIGREKQAQSNPINNAKPEVLPVSHFPVPEYQINQTKSTATPPLPLPTRPEPDKSIAEGSPPAEEGKPSADEEPEIDTSGGDYMPESQIPFEQCETESTQPTQSAVQYTPSASTQYIVLLMLRELAGNIEAQCHTDNEISKQRRRAKERHRHRHPQQEQTVEQGGSLL